MFKVNNKDIRTTPVLESLFNDSIKKRPQQRRRSGILIVNFEHISHPVLVFLL